MPSATVVVITGASQGLGHALALAFAGLPGTRLALVARSAGKLAEVAAECRAAGADAEAFVCDVTDAAAVAAMAAGVEARFGAVDVLVNNAGAFVPVRFVDMAVDQFDAMLGSNLRSVFLVTRAFVPGLVARRRGDIFNICSVAGLEGLAGCAGYGAAKFGVRGLSKVLREELRQDGIRVCCVYPGATDTPSWDGSGVDPQRLMAPEAVAAMVVAAAGLDRRCMLEDLVLRPQLGNL